MKKFFLIFVVSLLWAVSAFGAVSGDLSADWRYELLEDGTVTITGYSGEDTDVVIPAELEGSPVTSLAFDVFWFNEAITSVEIPESLTAFGDYVFLMPNQRWLNAYRDNGKPYILVPDVAKILVDYFAEYADEVHVNPFLGCSNLEKIIVSPDNPAFAVSGNMLISKITNGTIAYPAGRQETAYDVPDGITSIGFQTFFGSGLESVSLPASLAEIAQNPFIFCVDLKDISVSAENEMFSVRDGVLVSNDGTLISCPMASGAETYTVSDGIKVIGDGAFFNNMALREVILPKGVLVIGCRAFDHCESLVSAVLPEGLVSIDKDAFKNCEALREVNLPGTLTYIDEMAFSNAGKYLVFTAEKNTYGALWAAVQEYRFHFPGEPEKKSRLTQAYESLLDENGKMSKLHLKYRADRLNNGYWFTRDAYIADGVTWIVDENEADGVKVTMYKDKMLYTLSPDSKTGKCVEDEHWYFENEGVINETIRLLTLIRRYIHRSDYTSVSRMLQGGAYSAEVFPEYRYGPEIAFYFDLEGRLLYVYEEKYYGLSPVGYGTGELLFTIEEFSNDVDASVFDISDYEITQLPANEPVRISDPS